MTFLVSLRESINSKVHSCKQYSNFSAVKELYRDQLILILNQSDCMTENFPDKDFRTQRVQILMKMEQGNGSQMIQPRLIFKAEHRTAFLINEFPGNNRAVPCFADRIHSLIQVFWEKENIVTGEQSPDFDLAWFIMLCYPFHIKRIGDHKSPESHLFFKQPCDYLLRQRGRHILCRVELRNK